MFPDNGLQGLDYANIDAINWLKQNAVKLSELRNFRVFTF